MGCSPWFFVARRGSCVIVLFYVPRAKFVVCVCSSLRIVFCSWHLVCLFVCFFFVCWFMVFLSVYLPILLGSCSFPWSARKASSGSQG